MEQRGVRETRARPPTHDHHPHLDPLTCLPAPPPPSTCTHLSPIHIVSSPSFVYPTVPNPSSICPHPLHPFHPIIHLSPTCSPTFIHLSSSTIPLEPDWFTSTCTSCLDAPIPTHITASTPSLPAHHLDQSTTHEVTPPPPPPHPPNCPTAPPSTPSPIHRPALLHLCSLVLICLALSTSCHPPNHTLLHPPTRHSASPHWPLAPPST